MNTAYEQAKIDEAQRGGEHVDQYVRAFLKRYEPEDRRDRLDFERDLVHLVMLVHREATRPFANALSHATMSSPAGPVVYVKPSEPQK